MNDLSRTEAFEAAGWTKPKQEPEISNVDLLVRWRNATLQFAIYAAENKWSKSEAARRTGIAGGSFSEWFAGTYKGSWDKTTTKVEKYLTVHKAQSRRETALPFEPGFQHTIVAKKLFEAFTYAQSLPTIAIATIVSGLGKTTAAQAYQETRSHVFLITLSPSSRSTHNLKTEVAEALGLDTRNSAQVKKDIVAKLKNDGYNSLLIIDEAQHLDEDGINELRHFRDMAKCGLVLLGNDETQTPYASRDTKHASPQISRRVGFRITVMRPDPQDIETYLDAWEFTDPDIRAVGTAIAQKPGALGALNETIKAASLMARGSDRGLTAADLQNAYQFRGGDQL